MAFCSACGAQSPDGSTVCPACNRSTTSAAAAAPMAAGGGLADNVAGMLAYVTIIPAIIFLVTPPYNKSQFVRFHSFQSIFFTIACFVLGMALHFLVVIPVVGWLTLFLLSPLLWLAAIIIWIILLLKANQGQMYKLPVIGDLAEKQAAAF